MPKPKFQFKKDGPEAAEDEAEQLFPNYSTYVKHHKRKVRRAEREARGDNLESPPEKDYL